jgi:DNA-binding response OmpR family regulator
MLPVSGPQVVAQESPAGSVHRRVLVVDDDARSRNAVARLLTEEGYDATVAADGEEASGLVATWHPDLVLTDLNMPRLDGRGLLQRIKTVSPGTPVIVVTARAGADGRASVEGMGAAGFFAKPVQVDELLARIHDLIGH